MPEQASPNAFYISRPTLSVNGSEVPELGLGVLSLSVDEDTEGMRRAEITLGNWGTVNGKANYLYFGRELLDFGKALSVTLGEGRTRTKVFEGQITALEGRFPEQRPPEILILAEDRMQDLRMVRRTRDFTDTTVRSVIEQVAGAYNLATEIDLDDTTFAQLTQVNQSDLAFLRDCVRLVDGELWLEGSTLKASERRRRRRNDLTFRYEQRLFEFAVMADLANQRTALEVCGWDVDAKQVVRERAASDTVPRELSEGDSGAEVLAARFGERVERIVHQVPFAADEARRMAHSAWGRMSREFVRGRARMEGDGRVQVGSHLRLEGLGGLFGGAYYVSSVKHTFDPVGGFQTHARVERPRLGGG